jgi:hypothetical protein
MRQLRHRHAAPADQPHIRDGVVGSAKRAGRDQLGAVVGEAGDAVDVCGLDGFGQGHRRRDGGGVSSEWKGAAGHTITFCHRKSVDVGYHQLQGRLWGEAKVAKRVQGGEPDWTKATFLRGSGLCLKVVGTSESACHPSRSSSNARKRAACAFRSFLAFRHEKWPFA